MGKCQVRGGSDKNVRTERENLSGVLCSSRDFIVFVLQPVTEIYFVSEPVAIVSLFKFQFLVRGNLRVQEEFDQNVR